jgi:glutathione S-transferase
MKLYFHPISTYSQKVVIAMYEKDVKFTPSIVNILDPAAMAEYRKENGSGKVPFLLLADGWKIPESTIIVEYLEGHHPQGTKLIPDDKDLARRTRFMDRVSDLYLNNPMQTILFDGFKPEGEKEPKRVAAAKETIDAHYELLDVALGRSNKWALGEDFTMADCALAGPLFYLHKMQPYSSFKNIDAYWNRLNERPSVKRAISEALPYLQKMGMA